MGFVYEIRAVESDFEFSFKLTSTLAEIIAQHGLPLPGIPSDAGGGVEEEEEEDFWGRPFPTTARVLKSEIDTALGVISKPGDLLVYSLRPSGLSGTCRMMGATLDGESVILEGGLGRCVMRKGTDFMNLRDTDISDRRVIETDQGPVEIVSRKPRRAPEVGDLAELARTLAALPAETALEVRIG